MRAHNCENRIYFRIIKSSAVFVSLWWRNLEALFQFCTFCGSELPNAANWPEQDVEPVVRGNEISCEEVITRYFRQDSVLIMGFIRLSALLRLNFSLLIGKGEATH